MDLQNKYCCPSLEEVGLYIGDSVFAQFCSEIKDRYKCSEKIEFSSCSWEKGWNIKFKKAGKTLCTLYPRKGFFTALVVIGEKEKETVEMLLPACSAELQEVYSQTKEFNGQRWLMLDLKGRGPLYDDVFRLIQIRRG
jgi:hypothetical protein